MPTPLGHISGELQDVREFVQYGSVAPVISSTKAYTGNYSIRFAATTAGAGIAFPAKNNLRCGAWINHAGLVAGGAARILSLYASATEVAYIRWQSSDQSVQLKVNTTVRASGSAAEVGISPTNTWIHVGLTCQTGANGTITFWVNGIARLTYTGAIAENITLAYMGGRETIVSAFNNYAYMDDFYVDSDIDVSEAPPPDRFLMALPSGAGSSAQWTPNGAATNHECVDDPIPNDDTDTVSATAAGKLDLYTFGALTIPNGYSVEYLAPTALAKVAAAGPTVQFVAANGVNANLEGAERAPGTEYSYIWTPMAIGPDGNAWTQESIDAAQFGLKSAGSFS